MLAATHPLNWYAGWMLLLIGFLSGAVIGIGFHREDFWGGYASFRRRIVRLGHVALVALGMLNVLFAVAVPAGGPAQRIASILFVVGGVAMPTTCILTGWKSTFRHLFFVPVLSLIAAVVFILMGGAL